MNKSKIFMITSICILCVSIIGSTLAYYTKTLFNETTSTVTHGLDYYINYQNGQTISTTTLNPSDDYTGGAYSDIELWKKDNTYDIYGHIYLDITTMSDALSSSSGIKYAIVNNNGLIAKGTVQNNSENTILMIKNVPLETTKQLYRVYIWLDKNENLDPTLASSSLSLSVRCEATMKKINYPLSGAALHITNLYLNNKDTNPVVNNGISYGYASIYDNDTNDNTSGGLMNDRHGSMSTGVDDGNVRYYGANPNNYIYFNCNDYSSQSEDTCELWRIIGVFDGKVKIMRNSVFSEKLSWDQDKNHGLGATTYNNDWSNSSLQEFLNGKYYDRGEDTTYTYYNGSDGSSSVSINLENIGIKNDETRGLISETLWYLRGSTNSAIYSDQMYDYERNSGNVYNTSWFTIMPGNIAIPYVSDYGYAADFGSCNKQLSAYNDTTCTSANWMKPILGTSSYGWLMAPYSSTSYYAWNVYSSGRVYYSYGHVYDAYGVAPVLHLNSELGIKTGNGSQDTPYKLLVN